MTTARRDTDVAGLSELAESRSPRLTQFSPGGGCACKLPQQLLDNVLTGLPALGGPALGGPALGGPALGGPALGGPALGGPALGGPALGGPALGGPALGGPALGGPALGGPALGAAPGHAAAGGAPVLRVGLDPADDAAVLDLPGLEGRSLVVTCDFLTPVVDDPYDWGRIAATNALSDVYAMGGRPLLALNLLAWPDELDPSLLAQVMAGGARAVSDAGALLAGGHSIRDPAPKYGLAVVGEVDHAAILRKGGGQAGDRLVLTKPVGVGVIGTAIKRGAATAADVEVATVAMTRSNAAASAAAVAVGLRGGTDVTGYGLLGHLHEMTRAAGVAARLWPAAVPLLPGVVDLVESGSAPDGSRRTLAHALDAGWFDPGDADPTCQLLLADAQTSGGLLLAVPESQLDLLLAELDRRGEGGAVVGELVDGPAGSIRVEPQPRIKRGGGEEHP